MKTGISSPFKVILAIQRKVCSSKPPRTPCLCGIFLTQTTFKGNPAGILPGFLFGLVFPMGCSTTFHPMSSTGCRVPDNSVTASGFRYKSKSRQTHLRTVVGSPDQVGNSISVRLPTPLTHKVLSGSRHLSTTRQLSGS